MYIHYICFLVKDVACLLKHVSKEYHHIIEDGYSSIHILGI